MEIKTNQSQLDDIFSQMAKQNEINPDTSGIHPVLVEPVVPVAQAPVVTEPVVPVTPSAVAPTVPVVADLDAPVDSWDEPVAPVVPATPVAVTPVVPSFDFSEIAKVLDKQEIKSSDELINTVRELKEKAGSLSSLPENLTKAIEIAQIGGNYLEYLGVTNIDWSKEDPITLYENYVIDQYTDRDGKVDYEKVDKLLDKIDEDDKELRGRELQRGYINYQVNQKAALENQARAQKAQFETSVRNTVNSLQELAGFKLSQSHKDELVNMVLRGEDLKTQSVDKRIFNAFITKNWDKIDSFRKKQIKNSVKKELLDEVQNPEIKPVGGVVTAPVSNKAYGIEDYMKELSQPKKF